MTELAALLSRYFAAVDDKQLTADVVAATFAEDARIVRPDGATLDGRDAILTGQTESFARFRATHHMLTDHVVDVDGDTARIRANLQAMHLWGEQRDPAELASHFVAGGVMSAVAVRTAGGERYLPGLPRVRRRRAPAVGGGCVAAGSDARHRRPGRAPHSGAEHHRDVAARFQN